MNRLLHSVRTRESARSSFWNLLLAGLLLVGLTGCYTQLAATKRVYYEEEAEEARERLPDRVIVERYEDDRTVIKEYYYYNRPPYYYRRYFARFYGDPFFYYDCFDPFYYDPFYCDPFYYGPTFRFRLSFFFGDPFLHWPHVHHGYYWFYGFGYYYYSPYYWAYYPGHLHYFFATPSRGRIAWNYAPRGTSLGRSAWIGRAPRLRGRSRYEREDTYARTRSIVRTTRGTRVAPRHASTGVERHSTQEATRTRARTVTRSRGTRVRSERPRATTGRSVVTRGTRRSGEPTRSTVTRRTTRQTERGRSVARPERRRPTVKRPASNQDARTRVQRAPARRSPDRPARSTRRTRPRGNHDDRKEMRQYQHELGATHRAPSVRTFTPGHTWTRGRSVTPAPRVHPPRPRSIHPSASRIRSAPAPRSTPAVRSAGHKALERSRATVRSHGRGGARGNH